MIRITILYPRTPETHFDFDYYLSVHMPLSIARLGHAMKGISVERVEPLGDPFPQPEHYAVCSFTCSSLEAYQAAFYPHMDELQGDMTNYTNSQPIILLGRILIEHRGGAQND